MKITEQETRNAAARINIERTNKESGLRWNFISSQIGVSYHSFVHWRKGKYLFGESRLKAIESFIVKYDNIE